MFKRKSLALLFCALVALLTISLAVSRVDAAAGGEIAGTVSDPKGAVVVGASVTVTDPSSNQVYRAVTDAQGRYKITGLPAGIYVVAVSAEGFGEARRDNVPVLDNKPTTLDVRLELAAIDAGSITVTASGAKGGKGDAVYQQLRAQATTVADFNGAYAAVNNLVLKRDAATFTLRSGEIYFLSPVEGRHIGAVFIGDGELSLTPPVAHERHSLALFTGQPSLTEQFTKLTLRFTDKTFEEIKGSPAAAMRENGAQSSRARDIYRDHQSLVRKTLRTNLELRTLVDLYTPERPGFFNVFIGGKRFEKLIFMLDPRGIPEVSPEEVMLMSYGESDRGYWTAFHLAEEHRTGKASSAEDHRLFDITHHDIEAEIRGTKITATDRVTLRPLASGLRVLPFDFYPTLRVLGVRDEAGRELPFVQENKDEDADFGVIWPEALEAGKTYKISIEYRGGDAIADAGMGNFFLLPPARSTWYPNNGGTQFGDRALFNVTFRYPKNHLFIGTGALTEPEGREGDMIVAKWSSGQTELAVAGFNYGKFKKKEVLDKDTGYNVEFYANTEMPDFMRGAGIGSMSTLGGADTALTDTQNATRIYTHFFGKLPYTRLAMSQQPAGSFGQAWPTLIYMPFTAFLDSTQRWSIMGAGNAANNFWRYVGPHEVAHQWWGHLIGWTSYRDQWMSEGFAEFSTSLYVQYVRKDTDKFIDFWNDQRERITQVSIDSNGRRPYLVGPVTQGYRLNSGKTGNVARNMIYPKGAYILHMLRMMMYDAKGGTGDKRFMTMMQDFIKTHYNRDVSTEDLKRIVEKHMTQQMNLDGNNRMDWFFNQWVYGTEIPSYKFDYQVEGNTLSGRITQSGVSENFAMLVPVYIDFGKGWHKIGALTLVGNTSFDLPKLALPQTPKRVAVAAFNDVLALDIENKKK